MDILESVNSIMDEYNKNHGSDGRYISGASGVGKDGIVDFSKFLSEKEMVNIKSVAQSMKDKEVKDVDKARRDLIYDMTGKNKYIVELTRNHPTSDAGQAQQIAFRNRLFGRADDHGMGRWHERYIKAGSKPPLEKGIPSSISSHSAGDLRNFPEYQKATAIFGYYNQEFMTHKFPDGVEVYRGVSGNYAKKLVDAASSPNGNGMVQISQHEMSSWTTNLQIARKYAFHTYEMGGNGAVIKAKLKGNEIWDSPYTTVRQNRKSAAWGFDEVIFSANANKNKTTISVVESKFK